MAWNIEGTYFENCSCDAICSCTWSSLSRPATKDFCKFLMCFNIDSGTIEGQDVAGRTFAVLAETPKVMMDGNWKAGLYVDDGASSEQADAIAKVVTGQLGGPMAMLAPLITEFKGVELVPMSFKEDGGKHSVTIGSDIDVEVTEQRAPDFPEPTKLTGVMHPANTTLTVAPPTRAKVSGFGISFGGTDTSGFAAPISWSG